jgi:hypothetical protein
MTTRALTAARKTPEGWWTLAARSCDTLLKGALVARFYYIYAVDYDRGGEWSGKAYMCTRDKEFTIRGTEDCLARGFDRTGFFEVDTGEQPSWTVQLTRIRRSRAAAAAAVASSGVQPPPTSGRPPVQSPKQERCDVRRTRSWRRSDQRRLTETSSRTCFVPARTCSASI